jgi:hypothetical protein
MNIAANQMTLHASIQSTKTFHSAINCQLWGHPRGITNPQPTPSSARDRWWANPSGSIVFCCTHGDVKLSASPALHYVGIKRHVEEDMEPYILYNGPEGGIEELRGVHAEHYGLSLHCSQVLAHETRGSSVGHCLPQFINPS